MKITNVAIKYRTSVVVMTLLLIAGGLLSYTTIPKESFPSIEIPQIVVTTIYPGASPDDIESIITQQIEREVQGVNGIKSIRSTSTEGVSTVIVEFNPDVTMDDAFQKVRDKVDVAKAKLPDDVEEPMVNEIDVQEIPIMTINLAAPYALSRLKEVGEDLADELEAIPSVLEVDVLGGLEREVQVNINLNALKGYNVTFNDLVTAIRQENVNLPGGSVDVDRLNYLVRIDGEFEDPSQIENLVIKAPNGRPIYVRDVAEVVFGYKDRSSYAYLQRFQLEDDDDNLIQVPQDETAALQVISLNVKKRTGDNILEASDQIRARLEAFAFPAGTRYVVTGDQSEMVQIMVKDLENNIISGLFFVVAVLLFFLGVRNAFLVGIAIPLSMFISFIVFQVAGYTLNFVILFSLIIALGMLVDNAIVIVENIFRFREQGHSRFEAARLGTAEVAGPVVASTATTVAAFAPMLFWPGLMGEFMSYMPFTLIVTLLSSLFVAILINPVITGIFVRLEGEDGGQMSRRVKLILTLVMVVFGAVLGFANWRTLVVILVAVPLIMLLHKGIFKPIAHNFVSTGLPKLTRSYRQFLEWMLERDYSVRRAYLRNTFALGAFTLGVLVLVLGGAVGAMAGNAASMILLVPGGLLVGLGLLGIFVHTFESILVGRGASVKAGLVFGGVMLAILGLMYLSPRSVALEEVIKLLMMPALIVVVGLLGVAFVRRKRLILTDNRARLLNGVMGGLFAIGGMFALAPTGVELFPATDPNMIMVTMEGQLGTNIEASNKIALLAQERIDAFLREDPTSMANMKNVITGVGVGGDMMFGGGAASTERSRLTLNLVDYGDRPESSKETMRRLRDQLQGIPGVEIEFKQDDSGPPTGAPVNIEVRGPDFREIARITTAIKTMLSDAAEAGVLPDLVDVTDNLNTGRPELKVKIDRERAARFGLNSQQVASTVRSAINGIEAGKYRDGEDEYDITVRLTELDRASLESLRNLTILEEGQQIPIVALADFEVSGGFGSITRLDLDRVATISGNAVEGANSQAVLAQVQAFLADYEAAMPPAYTLSYTGESEDQQEAFGFLGRALFIAVALIFMIMIAQFNSVSLPFIIMVAVGLSFFGVTLGLVLTRTPFGLMTFIGVISLAGIVVNNNIVLIDYIQQLRQRGLNKHEAILDGGATRLRPVLLTALTTIIGLIPLTFGINVDFVGLLTSWQPDFQIGSQNTQFWGPMGASIISGLTFATFLTLVIVPVMYSAFDSIALKLGEVFASKGGTEASGAASDEPSYAGTNKPYAPPALSPTGNGNSGGVGLPRPAEG